MRPSSYYRLGIWGSPSNQFYIRIHYSFTLRHRAAAGFIHQLLTLLGGLSNACDSKSNSHSLLNSLSQSRSNTLMSKSSEHSLFVSSSTATAVGIRGRAGCTVAVAVLPLGSTNFSSHPVVFCVVFFGGGGGI